MTSETAISEVLQSALEKLSDVSKSNLFMDLDLFSKHVTTWIGCFPPQVEALHCLAVKTCPLPALLATAAGSLGLGAEAASLEEVVLATRAAGVAAQRVVWDGPCKTEAEINQALAMRVNINADNFQELEHYARHMPAPTDCPRFLGLRVNPCIGAGSIQSMSTATAASKFGVPLDMYREQIVQAYHTYPWLNSTHVHIGSQGCDYRQIAAGVAVIVELCEQINSQFAQQKITCIDIGGGLPVDYSNSDVIAHLHTFSQYVAELHRVCPVLLSGKYRLVTELGRSLTAKCGWALSQVEYTKRVADRTIVTQHIGANLLMRQCYLPETWRLMMFFCDPEGKVKPRSEESDVMCDVVGPLCFSGDVIAHERPFPLPKPGDWLVVLDCGSNTLGLWSKHCSRTAPPVFGYRRTESGAIEFVTLKKKETLQQAIDFWS